LFRNDVRKARAAKMGSRTSTERNKLLDLAKANVMFARPGFLGRDAPGACGGFLPGAVTHSMVIALEVVDPVRYIEAHHRLSNRGVG